MRRNDGEEKEENRAEKTNLVWAGIRLLGNDRSFYW
jgi:hypothetical protein